MLILFFMTEKERVSIWIAGVGGRSRRSKERGSEKSEYIV